VRKQYHLRKSAVGFDAWDVDRLIKLSKELPVLPVPLESIAEIDENYWFQGGGEEQPVCRSVIAHARLINDADLAFPILLCAEGRVMDGMHRVAKALLQEAKSILAIRFLETPAPDYIGIDPNTLPY
jgi:hypothetical protein